MRTEYVRHMSLSYVICTHVVRSAQTAALVCTSSASRRTGGHIRYWRRRWQCAGIAPLPPTRPAPHCRLVDWVLLGDVQTRTHSVQIAYECSYAILPTYEIWAFLSYVGRRTTKMRTTNVRRPYVRRTTCNYLTKKIKINYNLLKSHHGEILKTLFYRNIYAPNPFQLKKKWKSKKKI